MDAELPETQRPAAIPAEPEHFPAFESPFLRAPERARTIFLVTLAAACGPLLAGLVLFGWRAGVVAAISIASCAAIERLYFRVTGAPALLDRSHAYFTGLLLALTLPPYVPWYVPVVAAAFAIIVGKGIFGGVGHFLWQPALVGRLAVTVMFPTILAGPDPNLPGTGPILAQNRLLMGDVCYTRYAPDFRGWRGQAALGAADAFLIKTPSAILQGLTLTAEPAFSALAETPDPAELPQAKPAAIMRLPVMADLLWGSRPGGIGETSALMIILAGVYLVYRNYVKPHLPLSFIIAAACVAAIAPIRLSGASGTAMRVWFPLLAEKLDTGCIYVAYQLLSGELLLAAVLLATEMTSRPVTSGGQVIFGLGCGALAMLLKLYVDTTIPAYMAVLAMNTLAPTIDAIWRPRVLGQRRFAFLRLRRS